MWKSISSLQDAKRTTYSKQTNLERKAQTRPNRLCHNCKDFKQVHDVTQLRLKWSLELHTVDWKENVGRQRPISWPLQDSVGDLLMAHLGQCNEDGENRSIWKIVRSKMVNCVCKSWSKTMYQMKNNAPVPGISIWVHCGYICGVRKPKRRNMSGEEGIQRMILVEC